jgi:DNA polymerase (family 10)
MRNAEVADVLEELADLSEMMDEEWQPRAYRRAAREIRGLPTPIEAVAEDGDLEEIEGVGEAIAYKIRTFLETGTFDELEEYREEYPVDVRALTRVQGLGPKRIRDLHEALGITTLDELEAAAEAGEIQGVSGFGAKTEQNILDHIPVVREGRERTLLGEAAGAVEDVLEELEAADAFRELQPVGSYRRRTPTVGDVDVLAVAADREAAADALASLDDVDEVLARGETKTSVRLRDGLQVDLRVVDGEAWGSGLAYFTGSQDHNIALRGRAQERGWTLNEYGLFEGDDPEDGKRLAGATEEGLHEALDLDYMPPELREDRGEVEAAAAGDLPDLVTREDVRGDLQMHTTWSDGRASVRAMAEAGQDLGHEYILVTDHGPSLHVAGGPDEEELAKQREEVQAADEALDIRVLHGLEANVDESGLDVSPEACRDLDLVVASLHDAVDDATDRLVQAIEDYPVDVVGHPTNRLIHQREGNDLDLDRLAEAASAHDVALEINAQPDRMDLPWQAVHRLRGDVLFSIGTDAHSPAGLEHVGLAVDQARKGWLEPGDVVNTLPADELLETLRG